MGNEASIEGGVGVGGEEVGGNDSGRQTANGSGITPKNAGPTLRNPPMHNDHGHPPPPTHLMSPLSNSLHQREMQEQSPQDPRPQQQQQHHQPSRFSFSNHPGPSKNGKKIKAYLKQKAQQISDKAALVQQSHSEFLASSSNLPKIHAPLSFQKKGGGGGGGGGSIPSQRRMKDKQRKQNAQKNQGGQQNRQMQQQYSSYSQQGENYGKSMHSAYSPQENWMAQQHYQHQQQLYTKQQEHHHHHHHHHNHHFQQQQSQSQKQYRGGEDQGPMLSETLHQKSAPKSPTTQTVMNVMYHPYPPSPRRSNGTVQSMSEEMGNMSLNGTHRSPDLIHKQNLQQDGVQGGTTPNNGKNVNDEENWKHAWEEDEGEDSGSDSDENDDNDLQLDNSFNSVTAIIGRPPQENESMNQPSTPTGLAHTKETSNDLDYTSTQLLRPTLDAGHSSPYGITSPTSSHNQPQHPPSTPVTPMSTPHQTQALHNGALRIGPHRVGDSDLTTRRVETALERDENAVAWDTASPTERYEKPNIIMFLPLLRVLGKGSFGKVVLVQKRVGFEKGRLFAMKILKKTHLLRRGQIERTRTERKVLSLVDHPFIMKLHFAFQSDDKLFLVLDYCSGGELFFHLTRYRKFSERMAQFYAAELLLALGHLHSKGIIYRDLKPENVLFDSEGHIKLGDFGLAKDNIRHPYKGAKSVCGTPEYMAPEILLQMGHGFCVDYWGLGMLIFEMMTGLPPWYTTDQQLMMRRLKSAPLEIPSFFSSHARSCVYSLLQRDPRRRLGVRGPQAVAEHTFFRSLDFRAILKRQVDAPIRPCGGWKPPAVPSSNISDSKGDHNTRDTKELQSNDLEAATANFSDEFTRMAVNSMSEDQEEPRLTFDHSEDEELNENTFIGFTFDEQEVKL